MRRSEFIKLTATGLVGFPSVFSLQKGKNIKLKKSKWVHYNAQHQLVYKTLKRGSRITNFSYAGYMGGGASIPDIPVVITLSPVAGDNTEAIQNAIDKVSKCH